MPAQDVELLPDEVRGLGEDVARLRVLDDQAQVLRSPVPPISTGTGLLIGAGTQRVSARR